MTSIVDHQPPKTYHFVSKQWSFFFIFIVFVGQDLAKPTTADRVPEK